jgi:hypothetical protein
MKARIENMITTIENCDILRAAVEVSGNSNKR